MLQRLAITAALAFGYHREVLAVPGPVTANFSRGCNKLIKTQVAQLVESAEDIIKIMGFDMDSTPTLSRQGRIMFDLSDIEASIYQNLQENGELSIDALATSSGLEPGTLAAALLTMECKGVVRALPGKRFIAN